VSKFGIIRPVCLNLSARLISHGTLFFFHNKTVSADLSAAETISQTGQLLELGPAEGNRQ
jgi:hypothetical protein